MDDRQNQIGSFIKKQREKNKLSQNKLAELLYKDRTVISKWENDKLTPSINDIISLSKIFNISIEELLSGKEITDDNKNEIHTNFNNYLIKQNNKLKKLKLLTLILFLIVLIVLIGFFLYYFYNSYKTTKVFRVYGETENYTLDTSLLIITRERSYLKLGNISDMNGKEIKYIKLYYVTDDGKEKIIFEGEPNDVLTDFTGYDSGINFGNIKKLKDNLYISFDAGKKLKMKLNLQQDFVNDSLIFKDVAPITTGDIENNRNLYEPPKKILKNFKCNDTMCEKNIDDFTLYYDIQSEMFFVQTDNELIEYDVSNDVFVYYNNNEKSKITNFTVEHEKMNCFTKKCDEEKNIYNYYMKYINEYL